MTPAEFLQWKAKWEKDEAGWIQAYMFILDRDTNKQVPFIFNDAQKDYEKKKTDFDLIDKARKQGFSSRIIAGDIWACAFKQNQYAVLICQDKDATLKQLNDRVKPMLESCVWPIVYELRGEFIIFPETNSKYYIGTAGAKKFGRGMDITRWHLSEKAHWENPEIVTGLEEAALPGAVGRIETTANGTNHFHRDWVRAVAGKGRYAPYFCPWFIDSGYRIPGGTVSDLDDKEQELVRAFDLDQEQLAWRRKKINDMSDPSLFPQEYPSTPEESFISSGRMVFDWVSLIEQESVCRDPEWVGDLREADSFVELRQYEDGPLKVWEVPKRNHRYIVGADIAEGIEGGAYSAAFVFDIDNRVQVAEWHGHIDPDRFGDVLYLLGTYYNSSLMAPEAWPGPGGVTTARLVHLGYPNMAKIDVGDAGHVGGQTVGWATTSKTRPRMIWNFAGEGIRDRGVVIRSKELIGELRAFIYDKNNHMVPQPGTFSDRLMAACISHEVGRNLDDQPPEHRAWKDFGDERSAAPGVSVPIWTGPRAGVRS